MRAYLLYIFKRILGMIPVLLIVSIAVFFMLRLSSTSEVSVIIGERQATEELQAQIIEEYGLDQPKLLQYINWLKGVLTGDFGTSYDSRQNINTLIASRIPVTLGLVFFSSLIGILLGVILGVISALHRNKPLDTGISVILLFFCSVPSFLVSIVALIIVVNFVPGYAFVGTYSNVQEYFQRLILPSAIMAASQLALIGRVTRSSMTAQLQSAYIVTARAKGLSKNQITYKHAFHNAVIPVLTVAGMSFANTIGGTVLIEQIFSLPGIGGLLISSVLSGDYPVVQILVMFMLVIYLFMSLIVDLLYVAVDPRVRLQ